MNDVLKAGLDEASRLPDAAQEELGRRAIEWIDRWQVLHDELEEARRQIERGEGMTSDEVRA